MKILNIVKNKYLIFAIDDELKVFFYKTIGDFNRFIAESASGDTLEKVKNEALQGYDSAD